MELQELALRIRRGDREALKMLISEYGVGVYQKAYQKTQDKTLAREATRQTFAQLVTALQEQSDMDGWELWLNALAKRNIETYSNIGADMAYLENQLDRQLFAPPAQPVPDAASQFAMQQQYEAQQAQLRVQRQYETQQAQAQLNAQRQYEAQRAQQRLRQYEAQLAAQQPAQAEAQQAPLPPQPAEQNAETPSVPAKPASDLPGRRTRPAAGGKRRKKERLVAEAEEKRTRASAWPVVVLLVLLCVVLLWLVLGVVMSFGWLPKTDLGYEWFNTHILDLF